MNELACRLWPASLCGPVTSPRAKQVTRVALKRLENLASQQLGSVRKHHEPEPSRADSRTSSYFSSYKNHTTVVILEASGLIPTDDATAVRWEWDALVMEGRRMGHVLNMLKFGGAAGL